MRPTPPPERARARRGERQASLEKTVDRWTEGPRAWTARRPFEAGESPLTFLESLPATVGAHAGAFAAVFVYSSLFEWTLHRYLMHRPLLLRYPYRTHALTHHRLFRADSSYFLSRKEDAHDVSFAFWNAPLLIGLHAPLLWLLGRASGWPVLVPGLLAMSAYYALYESLHWCMHVPKGRWFERTAVFRWLSAHHRAHHLHHDTNLNVVLPLADILFGTLRPWTRPAGLARAETGRGAPPGSPDRKPTSKSPVADRESRG
ncbi:MAG TPA: sterol desaturase family protein [Planctomycetota bacterium]|nr:sterol desaturase family protein [Planctomycetota bacterium]